MVALFTKDFHTCAFLAGNGIDCWGDNSNGQLGTGDTTTRLTPTGVAGLSGESLSVPKLEELRSSAAVSNHSILPLEVLPDLLFD